MTARRLWTALALAGVLGLAGGCDAPATSGAGGGVGPGAVPPPLAIEMVHNPARLPVGLEDARGKVLVLGFWLGGCAPCLAEIPELKALTAEHGPDGLEVLLVNVGGNRRIVEDLARTENIPFPMALDTLSLSASRYGVAVFPTVFIIDRQGTIRARLAGAQKPGHLTAMAASLL